MGYASARLVGVGEPSTTLLAGDQGLPTPRDIISFHFESYDDICLIRTTFASSSVIIRSVRSDIVQEAQMEPVKPTWCPRFLEASYRGPLLRPVIRTGNKASEQKPSAGLSHEQLFTLPELRFTGSI